MNLGAAAELAQREAVDEARRVAALRDRLRSALGDRFRVNGSMQERLPGNLSVCIEGVDGRALVLDWLGVLHGQGALARVAGHRA